MRLCLKGKILLTAELHANELYKWAVMKRRMSYSRIDMVNAYIFPGSVDTGTYDRKFQKLYSKNFSWNSQKRSNSSPINHV